mmetsp:Transcript_83992/g.256586  ORF Transcript_83992/g.256586 Transcript_83992/m.256586 type:complete len:200 (+) Transcript_83992:104-703(+)
MKRDGALEVLARAREIPAVHFRLGRLGHHLPAAVVGGAAARRREGVVPRGAVRVAEGPPDVGPVEQERGLQLRQILIRKLRGPRFEGEQAPAHVVERPARLADLPEHPTNVRTSAQQIVQADLRAGVEHPVEARRALGDDPLQQVPGHHVVERLNPGRLAHQVYYVLAVLADARLRLLDVDALEGVPHPPHAVRRAQSL